ncbi:hypothetical protein T265_01955 [Opisthorchis viverrini]|uniref:Tetratricopeptide repeat protein n=1 Tax=Opisthorchis viverrini TaxID=6198 RepID=A0A074ZXP2_OPIVI|nr:hypothetical protein T265_01955 [Opisthorchis viverrini]KER31866.1 hypothetical protein T265_01955 [Opisthorchis viverrini]
MHLNACLADAQRANIRVQAAMAKTYYRLKDTANARVYCEKVLASSDTGYEADEEKEEVQRILKKI